MLTKQYLKNKKIGIIALDPALRSLGLCVAIYENKRTKIVTTQNLICTNMSEEERLRSLYRAIGNLYNCCGLSYCDKNIFLYEQGFMKGKKSKDQDRLRGAAVLTAILFGMEIHDIYPTSWRSFFKVPEGKKPDKKFVSQLIGYPVSKLSSQDEVDACCFVFFYIKSVLGL